MDTKTKIEILRKRLNILCTREKKNAGAQRKIRRENGNLEKTLGENPQEPKLSEEPAAYQNNNAKADFSHNSAFL
ncbi:MAG: hypothetical protein LUC97_06660 [Clostridiales bacterium]|nr:hypothetical protein [Clostridiales bacterium]